MPIFVRDGVPQMFRLLAVFCVVAVFFVSPVTAQLPSDAVILAKVKIPEKQKSTDLCPVTLEPSDPDLPTWTHEGVEYRGSTKESQAEFAKDPENYAKQAARQRWINNFVNSMSVIWCPVTDEVNPGGGLQWEKLGLTWESCCRFCDEDVTDEDFPDALERLKERAEEAYAATGGKYVNDARSPVQGAIRIEGVTEFVGTWKLTVTAPDGRTFDSELSLEQEQDHLKGTITGRRGTSELLDLESDEDGNLSFAVERERDGETMTANYSATLDDGKLSGSLEVEFGGQAFTLEFEGELEEPAAEGDA